MYFIRIWNLWLDCLFPPSRDELRVRALTPEKLGALRSIPHAREIETLFPYAHADIRALLWQLKYKNDSRAAALLGTVLRAHIASFVRESTLVVPIPLSRERERARGYNQVTTVCAYATKDLPHISLTTRALARIRHTTPQTKLSRYERLKNMHGAFTVPNPALVQGMDILLVDDVTTTGSTLREAKETLLAAGAASVRCIALAH